MFIIAPGDSDRGEEHGHTHAEFEFTLLNARAWSWLEGIPRPARRRLVTSCVQAPPQASRIFWMLQFRVLC